MIVETAMNEVGTSEQGINEIKYNDWYYGKHTKGLNYPWCATFISWCAYKCGIVDRFSDYYSSYCIIPKTASVLTLKRFFVSNNLFHYRDYTPKSGDIMIQIFDSGVGHVGIVYGVNNDEFYTIEGNCDGKVQKCVHNLNDKYLIGFGTPKYSTMKGE